MIKNINKRPVSLFPLNCQRQFPWKIFFIVASILFIITITLLSKSIINNNIHNAIENPSNTMISLKHMVNTNINNKINFTISKPLTSNTITSLPINNINNDINNTISKPQASSTMIPLLQNTIHIINDNIDNTINNNDTNLNNIIKKKRPSNTMTLLPIHMEYESLKLFIKYVDNKDYYVEWGSGGSTQIAPLLVNKKSFSIEHYPDWCNKLQNDSVLVSISIKLQKHIIECVDTKTSLVEWGAPDLTDPNTNITLMSDLYVNRIDKIILKIKAFDSTFNNIIDSVLVDGRFRVACALKLIVSGYVKHNKSVVLIHDYFERQFYHLPIETCYDIIDGQDYANITSVGIVVLNPKPMTNQLMSECNNLLQINMKVYH